MKKSVYSSVYSIYRVNGNNYKVSKTTYIQK